MFFVQKVAVSSHNSKIVVYLRQNSYLWSHTTELLNTNCGLCTARKYLRRFIYRSPQRGSLYNKYTRGNQTRNAKNNGRKIRIKDIAERAGVSVGTVDRVLHDRPNVSKPARDKVEKALKEMNYQPNVYASALAYNKSYTFYLLIPKHESEAYWEEIEEGAKNVKIPDVTSISM